MNSSFEMSAELGITIETEFGFCDGCNIEIKGGVVFIFKYWNEYSIRY